MEVTVSGKREVTKVTLAEEVVDPDDIEMLEDLIVAAMNEALRQVDAESSIRNVQINRRNAGNVLRGHSIWNITANISAS